MSRFADLCTAFRAMSPAEHRAAAIDGLRYLAEAYDRNGNDLALDRWLQQMALAIERADLERDDAGSIGIGAA